MAVLLAACAGGTLEEMRSPVPELLVPAAAIPGYGKIRYWGDSAASFTVEDLDLHHAQVAAAAKLDPSMLEVPARALTISGGGSNGAFGAGLLVGWSRSGRRPDFDIVTGISTGAMIAPMAFLGQAYDPLLETVFTTISGKDVFEKKGILAIIGSESIGSNEPLRLMIADAVSDRMLADVAREHARGRRLFIGTTNIDAERPVIWDMGAIASSDAPDRRKLFQDIIVASAAIPGVFPPVHINVTAQGQSYDELHVDGGTSNQVFLFPAGLSTKAIDKRYGMHREKQLFIIRNARTSPEYSMVKPKLASLVGKSISSLIKTQGIGDLNRLYVQSQRDGIDFNLIAIPEDFVLKETTPFDQAYMKSLFDEGHRMGAAGVPWLKKPPGLGN
jgi:predicted patatin/cPLA2 family phospholipase